MPALTEADVLVFPMSKSAFLQRDMDGDQVREMTLYYGAKEISFDDPAQFGFGEMLAKQTRFAAGEAASWSSGDWPRARAMLTDLIEHGVLRHADDSEADKPAFDRSDRPSPLPPAPASTPLTWSEETISVLTGKRLDPGYLELVVPVFRTVHMYQDRDGRQVGEANVFPTAARIDVPTQWRSCTYPGSRYQPDKPMNVTALKGMRVHWRQMMALLLHVREAYLNRFPAARNGWTVGDLERLSTAVLALPSYMMLRQDAPVANGKLHPVLSNLFRVTDGLRLTMHQMLFVPFYEPMAAPDMPVTAEQVFAYAERNYAFHSAGAVCAGPQFMIEEFLAVIMDGAEPKSGMPRMLDPEIEAAIALIEPAMDYAMLGLQAFGTIFSLWPAMTRAYHDLHQILVEATSHYPAILSVRERFQGHFDRLTSGTHLASEEWRAHREAVYDDMYANCVTAIIRYPPKSPLSAQLEPVFCPSMIASTRILRNAIARTLGAGAPVDEITGLIMDYLARTQAIIRVGTRIQAQTNKLLHRSAPARAFTLADINLHNILLGEEVRTLPFLTDELSDVFAISILVDADKIEIRERATTPLSRIRSGENRPDTHAQFRA